METIKHELIMEELQGRNCHASHCLPLADGSVLAVWFEGTKEGQGDVCIWGSKRSPQGVWSPKRRLTPDDGLPHWNPVLMDGPGDLTTLFYKKGKPIAEWYTCVMTSPDHGETWSKPRRLVAEDVGGRGPVRNKVIRLSNGWLLAPASLETGIWSMFADISKDDGRTWTRSQLKNIFHDGEEPETWWDKRLDKSIWRKKRGVIQPTFWESGPGCVHALMRSSEGRIYSALSHDYGQTWSRPRKTKLPNNNSGIDAVSVPGKGIYLVYNPVGRNWGERYPISIARSTDQGVTWEKLCDLETGIGKMELSYPCIQFSQGRLYITYTRNRTNIAFWLLTP